MTGFQVKENLRQGRCVVGTHILSLMNPTSAALTAEMAMDFAFICTEHIPLGRTEVGMMCQYYAAKGISPIVRVPSPDAVSIATMLDGGAEGIVVPYVETVEEVRRIVGAVKYRPIKGEMLRAWMEEGVALPEATARYLETFNRDKYVIIGVESVPAIERLDELLAVPGVDAVFLGPHDITTSMGIPTEYTHPRFVAAVESIIRRCRARSIGVGLHFQLLRLPGDVLERYLAAGMNWLINAADVIIMREAMNAQFGQLRQLAQRHLPGAIASPASKPPLESCLTSGGPA